MPVAWALLCYAFWFLLAPVTEAGALCGCVTCAEARSALGRRPRQPSVNDMFAPRPSATGSGAAADGKSRRASRASRRGGGRGDKSGHRSLDAGAVDPRDPTQGSVSPRAPQRHSGVTAQPRTVAFAPSDLPSGKRRAVSHSCATSAPPPGRDPGPPPAARGYCWCGRILHAVVDVGDKPKVAFVAFWIGMPLAAAPLTVLLIQPITVDLSSRQVDVISPLNLVANLGVMLVLLLSLSNAIHFTRAVVKQRDDILHDLVTPELAAVLIRESASGRPERRDPTPGLFGRMRGAIRRGLRRERLERVSEMDETGGDDTLPQRYCQPEGAGARDEAGQAPPPQGPHPPRVFPDREAVLAKWALQGPLERPVEALSPLVPTVSQHLPALPSLPAETESRER